MQLLPGLRRNAGSPLAPAGQAVLLLGGACPARQGDFPGGQECRMMPAWSPQEACLSVSRVSCHTRVTMQLLEPALPDQSCFGCLRAASAAALSERVQGSGLGGLVSAGKVLPPGPPPSQGSP